MEMKCMFSVLTPQLKEKKSEVFSLVQLGFFTSEIKMKLKLISRNSDQYQVLTWNYCDTSAKSCSGTVDSVATLSQTKPFNSTTRCSYFQTVHYLDICEFVVWIKPWQSIFIIDDRFSCNRTAITLMMLCWCVTPNGVLLLTLNCAAS